MAQFRRAVAQRRQAHRLRQLSAISRPDRNRSPARQLKAARARNRLSPPGRPVEREGRGEAGRRRLARRAEGIVLRDACNQAAPASIEDTTDFVAATEISGPAASGSTSRAASATGEAVSLTMASVSAPARSLPAWRRRDLGFRRLRDDDEQRAAQRRWTPVACHHGGRRGRDRDPQVGLDEVAQMNARVARTAAPADHGEGRLGGRDLLRRPTERRLLREQPPAASGISAISLDMRLRMVIGLRPRLRGSRDRAPP